MITIQTFQQESADFSQVITLDGTPYTIRITWNTRSESWYMDISTVDNTPILLGIRLVPNKVLLKHYAKKELPPGDFMLWDSQNTPNDSGLTFETLGTRYYLVYITEQEVQSL